MKNSSVKKVARSQDFTIPVSGTFVRTGRIAESRIPGQIFVSVNGSDPCAATNFTMIDDAILLKPESTGLEVVILFEDNDISNPLIVGARKSLLQEIINEAVRSIPLNLVYNGKHIEMEAMSDLVIRSGKSRITITNAGLVRIEGTSIEIVASGPSNIKGNPIALN
ncbi:MAG: hypothetical protein V1793_08020 [Pseudomonadota bacterium]